MMEYLQQLSEAIGISGREEAVRKIVLEAIDGCVDEVHVDALGSITAIKRGTEGSKRPKVMVDAHMDEVGFMATGVDGDGLIKFVPVGGIDARIVPGMRVKVGPSGIQGVVLSTPIHKNKDSTVIQIANMRIDIGASNKEEANGKVKKGDRIAFDSRYRILNDSTICGKSLDDRAGCSVLIDVLRESSYPCDILAAFTVQEEIGLRGAMVAARRLKPDVGLALECTTAGDIPNPLADPDSDDLADLNPTCRVGRGPTLSFMDRSMIADPRLLRHLRQLADVYGVPYQLKTQLGGGTDAGSIHRANTGVPSAVISLPGRYIHSPHALISHSDYLNAVRLAQAFLENLTHDVLKPL
ncbi:MAG: M42 family metallopeptidase [Anaerolineae bacterium]|nr:M42 family peptidase [Chloroflexota bacterium]MBV6437759.1 putative aminopeptidase YsdC [Anaerolineae bacterium]MDL1917369.1 M42 family metallopeptidase [Anaerolineae bacterium CFX4]MCO6445843.1 M42 family metallopeptidase [Anaerolineae bacterium]MEB2367229.1 M42 family metallopeptidase [Chloroflexota bacterium]